MNRKTLIGVGSVAGVTLLVLALWIWRHNEPIALRWGAHDLRAAAMAVQCIALAAAAAGEGLLVTVVLANVWRRDVVTKFFGLSAALVFLLSAAGAVALGLAGR